LTVDRYLIEELSDLGVVGAYTFYAGMCVALLGFVDAAIFSFARPKLVLSAKNLQKKNFNADMLQLSAHTFFTTVVVGLVIYFASSPLMQAIENPIYLEHLDLFSLLLIAFGLYIFSEVPRLGLYATRSDNMILYGDLIALLTFITSFAWLQAYLYGTLSVPGSMICAFVARFSVLFYFFFRERKRSSSR
jgi:O-antigen/teichoic acid export membrane protein